MMLPETAKTAVVLVCHPPYRAVLARAVEAIDRQHFDERILVFDHGPGGARRPVECPSGWRLFEGFWGDPCQARNTGLAQLHATWVVFWDADNVMPEGYLATGMAHAGGVPDGCAVLYPDVQEIKPDGTMGLLRKMPQFSYRRVGAQNVADTASFWRVEAVREVGGFPAVERLDDFALALKIFRAGWQGYKLPLTMYHLEHRGSRSARNSLLGGLWGTWSFAFVTLWSGSPHSTRVIDWLAEANLPPQSSLYWVDNSGGGDFSRLLMDQYRQRLASRFQGLCLRNEGVPYAPAPGEDYLALGRHKHVAALYNQILPRIREEVVVFLEDDVVPPKNGLRQLLAYLMPGSTVGMVAGVYQSRRTPSVICASEDPYFWRKSPRWDRLPDQPFHMGMTGGGFTICLNQTLQDLLPLRCFNDEHGALKGWDANLGTGIAERHQSIIVHPGVRCEHVCPEVLAYNAKRNVSRSITPRAATQEDLASISSSRPNVPH